MASWYVDPNASGTGAGTSWTNAWTSLGAIVWASINPGDVVYLSGGSVTQTYEQTATFTIGASGSAGSVITVRNGVDSGHTGTVVIDGTGTSTALVGLECDKSYVTLIGLTVQNWGATAIKLNGASNCTVQSCTGNPGFAPHASGASDGFVFTSTTSCSALSCTAKASSYLTSVSSCGFFTESNTSLTIANNFIICPNANNSAGSPGWSSFKDTSVTAYDNKIDMSAGGSNNDGIIIQDIVTSGVITVYNNIVDCGTSGTSAGILLAQQDTGTSFHGTADIWNNTVYGGAFCFSTSQGTGATLPTGSQFKNNILYATALSTAAYSNPQGNLLTAANVDYNCVYTVSPAAIAEVSGSPVTWAAWQTDGYDSHGINSDPKMLLPPDANAFRIADMLERFGVNLYPMDAFPGTNVYGAGTSCNYSTAGIIAAHDYLVGSSGLTMLHRLWTYQAANSPFLDLDTLASTIAQSTSCKYTMTTGGAIGSGDSIPWAYGAAQASLAGTSPWTGSAKGSVSYVEGYNEPNNVGGETAAQTAAGQAELYTNLSTYAVGVVGSSVVFGLPNPEGYITGFLGASTPTVANNSQLLNVHFYPPYNPDTDDGSGRGGSFNDVYEGIGLGYSATLPQIITEFHPTLYSNTSADVCDPAHDAYYVVMFILSAFRLGYQGYVWWSLLDFNDTAPSSGGFAGTGLWQHDPTVDTPRAAAVTLRALYTLTGDTTAAKHTFIRRRFNYSTSGLQTPTAGSPNTGGQTMLFQNNAGTFFLFVWNSQQDPGGTASSVTINFLDSAVLSVTEYNITDTSSSSAPTTAIQTLTGVSSITISLAAAVHLLVINP